MFGFLDSYILLKYVSLVNLLKVQNKYAYFAKIQINVDGYKTGK